MDIKTLILEIWNFKRIGHFRIEPNGKDVTIRGRNGTDKTTLLDAAMWCLTGKDSKNQHKFSITPIVNGEPVHNLETSVYQKIEIDGESLELKRTLIEVWAKKRGNITPTLSSHNTLYYIGDMEKKIDKREWDQRLGEILTNPEVYKLLTLPGYFNALPPDPKKKKTGSQRRRDILAGMSEGDITDQDVLESLFPAISDKDSFGVLSGILAKRSFDDHRGVIADKKEALNKRKVNIGPGIKELRGQLPDKSLKRRPIEAQIRNLNSKIQAVKDDTALTKLRKELAEAQTKLAEAQAKQAKDIREANEGIDKKVDESKKDKRDLKLTIDEMKDNQITANQLTIKRNKKTSTDLKAYYRTVKAQEQVYDEICPTCNQPLPPDQIEAARKQFNENQATELSSIQKDAKKLKADNEALKKTIDTDENKITALEKQIIVLEESIKEAEKGRAEVKPTNEIKGLECKIGMIRDSIRNHRIEKDLQKTLHILETERQEEQAKLATLDAAKGIKTRIEELKTEEKGLGAKFEALERQMYLIEQFTSERARMLEAPINEKFKMVQFRLFQMQMNESPREVCTTLVDGIPYGDSLNKGAEHNADMDIIDVLSGHYKIKAPVWNDNIEAVVNPLKIDNQTFTIRVADLWICDKKHVFARHKEKVKGKEVLIPGACPECHSMKIKEYDKMEIIYE